MSSELLREAENPTTPAARLLELAQASRETWTAIAVHPNAYPGLLDWLQSHGDDAVKAAIARREIALLPPPPAPPVADEATAPIAQPPAPAAPEPTEVSTPSAADSEPTVVEPTLIQQTPVVPAAAAAVAPAVGEPIQPPPPSDDTAVVAATTAGGDGSNKKSANVARTAVVLVVLAALVGGGWFGVQALTDDEKKTEANTIDVGGLGESGEDTDGGDDGGEGGIGGLTGMAGGDFCKTYDELEDIGVTGMGGMEFDPESGTMPDLQGMMNEMRDKFVALQRSAPAELQDDVGAIVGYFEALSGMTTSPGSGENPFASMDVEKFIEASTNIGQYYAMNC